MVLEESLSCSCIFALQCLICVHPLSAMPYSAQFLHKQQPFNHILGKPSSDVAVSVEPTFTSSWIWASPTVLLSHLGPEHVLLTILHVFFTPLGSENFRAGPDSPLLINSPLLVLFLLNIGDKVSWVHNMLGFPPRACVLHALIQWKGGGLEKECGTVLTLTEHLLYARCGSSIPTSSHFII